MTPLRVLYFAAWMVASVTARSTRGTAPLYTLQGGGSGLETEGDYVENKLVRRLYGVFGSAVDEAKSANKLAKGTVRDKIGWPFEDKPEVAAEKPTSSWMSGAKDVVVKEKHAVCKFFSNPSNVFVTQGLVALVFGSLNLFNFEAFGAKVAEPLATLLRISHAGVADSPHVKLVGAYLVGVLVSDVLAYKSNNVGFKRGKIWHEVGTTSALGVVLGTRVFSGEAPADLIAHFVAAITFSVWYWYLSQKY